MLTVSNFTLWSLFPERAVVLRGDWRGCLRGGGRKGLDPSQRVVTNHLYKPGDVITWCRRYQATSACQPSLGSSPGLPWGHLGLDALSKPVVLVVVSAAAVGLLPLAAAWQREPAGTPALAPLRQVPDCRWRRWHLTGSSATGEKMQGAFMVLLWFFVCIFFIS